MILILIGFILNSIGGLAIILETISGNYIRPKVYHSVLKGVHEYDINDNIIKIKLTPKEIRILIWFTLIIMGAILQLIGFII